MGFLPQERSAYLAIAQAQADAQLTVAQTQFTTITYIAQNDSDEAFAVASYRQGAELTNASNQNYLYQLTANLASLSEQAVAQTQASGIAAIAGYDVANIQDTAASQVSQLQGSANAQANEIQQTATIQAGGTASTAAIRAATDATEASIQAGRTGAIAQIQASTTQTTAQLDQSKGITLANMQAAEVGVEAQIAATERAQERDIRVGQYAADAQTQANLSAALAGVQVNETQQETIYRVNAIAGEAAESYRGSTVSAVVRGVEETTIATLRANASIEVATINATYQRYSAEHHLVGVEFRADQELTASEFADTKAANLVTYRANQEYQGEFVSANNQLQGTEYSADGDNTRRLSAATTEATAQKFGADQDYAGVVAKSAAEDATLAARLAYLLAKFNLFLADFQGASLPRTIPGFNGLSPGVSCRQVYSPSQVQRQLNALYNQAEQAQATALESVRSDYAGRGFSGQSPALYVERLQLTATKLRAVAGAGLSTRADVAAQNAERLLQAQELKSKLFLALQQGYVEAEKLGVERQVRFLDEVTRIVSEI